MAIKKITLFTLFLSLSISIFAQTKINAGFRIGLLYGGLDIDSKSVNISEIHSGDEVPNPNISASVSLPVLPHFRMGAEVGLLTYKNSCRYVFDATSNGVEVVDGIYRINQVFAAVVPEFRIFDWIYVNVGAGLYSDYNSHFTSGISLTSQNQTSIIGRSYKRTNSIGFLGSIGVCPNITDEFALLAEARFTASPASIKSTDRISIGYWAKNFNIGVLYKPKS